MNLLQVDVVNNNSENTNAENVIDTFDIPRFRDYIINDFFAFLDVSEKTIDTYRRALKQFFRFLSKNNISSPKYDDILLFKKELESKNCKSTTIGIVFSLCTAFLLVL